MMCPTGSNRSGTFAESRTVKIEDFVLTGRTVRLEPMGLHHLDGLLAAATADPSLYKWTVVPQTWAAMQTYVETAMALRNAGTGLAFATVRIEDGAVIGSTRFFDMERWSWPAGHARH